MSKLKEQDALSPKQVRKLLRGLNSSDPGPSWTEFLDHFSPLIVKATRQFDYGQDRSNECYLHVCEKLSDARFRRLLKFDTNGKASFVTWLGTVVFNLCVDWHRKEFGRASLLPAVTALPEFDKAVFRLRYQQGLPIDTCYELLLDEFPDLSRQQLANATARVHAILTPRQRWKMSLKVRSLAEYGDLRDTISEPDLQASQEQELESLRLAMSRLTPDQQLLLRLRYHQGLTLKDVARLARLGDPYRARRQIQAALDALSELMLGENSGQSRKN